jgi:hypothetical protein
MRTSVPTASAVKRKRGPHAAYHRQEPADVTHKDNRIRNLVASEDIRMTFTSLVSASTTACGSQGRTEPAQEAHVKQETEHREATGAQNFASHAPLLMRS